MDPEQSQAMLDREIRRYLASSDSNRKMDDAIARGRRYRKLVDDMQPAIDSGDPEKIRRAAQYIAEHLRRAAERPR